MRITRFFLFVSILTILFLSLSIGQQSSAADSIPTTLQDTPAQTAANISFDVNAAGTAINPLVLGTNLPAWLGPSRTEDSTFLNRTIATGTTILRIPGGSWSNIIDWYACETGNQNDCWFTNWGLRPSDFINFLRAANTEGMYTINMNGTSKEAAALVAFFNGSVSDNTVIGTDVNGRNWGNVSEWAQLRSDNGSPNPLYIKYWEIGNEIYGGEQGKDCAAWGWEDVWTCDGREYVNGLGSNEGFIAFRNAMRAVDPSILVGAVGVPDPASWSNWGNEVIEEAGDVMDFYIIHKYGFGSPQSNMQTMLAEPQGSWQTIREDIDAAFDQYADGRRIPIAITEYNLFAVEGQDVNERMSQAVNGLYLADTLGQMMKYEFDIANQWDLAHGDASIPSRYGLMRANNYFRSPQYYAFPMWARFGSEMLPVSSSHNAATELSVYAGRIDAANYSVMAINKTGNQITTSIEVTGASAQITGGTADVMKATSLTSTSVTFNGNSDPNDDLSNAPSTNLGAVANPLTYTFEPYSVTLLRFVVNAEIPTIIQLVPSSASVEESVADKTLTVNGEYFTPESVVRWNGSNLVTTFVNPTQLTAVIPAANLSLPGNAAVTVRDTVENTTSNEVTFTIVAAEPVITQLVPSFASVAESTSDKTLTINGQFFTPDCIIRWDGNNLATTYVSPTQLTAVIPAANLSSPGDVTVTVRNTAENLTSNGLVFSILPADPVITQLVPPFAGLNEANADKMLIVQGNYFTDDCVVHWNGTPLATDYNSPTQLTAVIPALNISSTGSVPITVYCQDEDTTSDPQTFTIVDEVSWVYLPGILK
jgi:alpha-L-arabinofuranosidase